MARIEFRAQMWANAEGYLRRALAAGTADRWVLWMMRDIMEIAAGQQFSRAMSLRWVKRWDDRIGNTVYEYTQLPSAEDLAQAGAAEMRAASFLGQSREYLNRAIRTLSNDSSSHDFVGSIAYRFKDYETARKAWEQAVKLSPNQREYRYSLANAYSKLDRVDEYLEQTRIGRNMEHTTAATEIRWAWRHINAGNGADAEALLERAVKVDPADPRALACLAVVAEARSNQAEAQALYRAALALEEAHALEDGCSRLTGAGRWGVNDVGRAIELRTRIAEALEAGDPGAAADLYLANVNLEKLIGDSALKENVHTAMLPLFGIGDRTRQDAPRFGELMRTSRALGAAALSRSKQYRAAAEHFRMLPGYDARHRAGGGKAFDKLQDGVWTSAGVAAAAVECFQSLGDASALEYWQTVRARAPAGAGRRHSPTSPEPGAKTRR